MKWFGKIGFEEEADKIAPGVYEPPGIIERDYYMDVVRNKKNYDTSQIVTDFNISNQLSILSDQFLNCNLHKIVYVSFMNTKWTVNSAEINYPRVILDIGGVYKDEGSN